MVLKHFKKWAKGKRLIIIKVNINGLIIIKAALFGLKMSIGLNEGFELHLVCVWAKISLAQLPGVFAIGWLSGEFLSPGVLQERLQLV